MAALPPDSHDGSDAPSLAPYSMLSVHEVALTLGVSVRTGRAGIASGEIPSVRVRGRRLVSLAYLVNLTAESPSRRVE
jgi:excisionase family DNA binding protein